MSERAELERRLVDRINVYLLNGGLWNPESMEHEKVRELLVGCREALLSSDTADESPAQSGQIHTAIDHVADLPIPDGVCANDDQREGFSNGVCCTLNAVWKALSKLRARASQPPDAPSYGTCDGGCSRFHYTPHFQTSLCKNWKPARAEASQPPMCSNHGDRAIEMKNGKCPVCEPSAVADAGNIYGTHDGLQYVHSTLKNALDAPTSGGKPE